MPINLYDKKTGSLYDCSGVPLKQYNEIYVNEQTLE